LNSIGLIMKWYNIYCIGSERNASGNYTVCGSKFIIGCQVSVITGSGLWLATCPMYRAIPLRVSRVQLRSGAGAIAQNLINDLSTLHLYF
jgi:hypothetical protein